MDTPARRTDQARIQGARLTADSAIDRPAARVDIALGEAHGWCRFSHGEITLWAKGYGKALAGQALARAFASLGAAPSAREIEAAVGSLDGHFALVVQGDGWALAAVDRVRSIPVAFGKGPDGWIIDDQANRLRLRLGLGERDINEDAALALAMSGYAIDVATLYNGIGQLGPGELAVFGKGDAPVRRRYYCYRPWRADKPRYDAEASRKALAETLLETVDEMMQGIGDRILVVPLSAGRDSRLIVSAARHLGYANVRTFAYGRAGNHEANTSRYVAERLGYDWTFVPTDTAFMRRYFSGDEFDAYCSWADTLQSVPFVQDMPQIRHLKKTGYVPGDAVLANGNSGDFISGAHIVPEMQSTVARPKPKERLERAVTALEKKHFSLWQSLRTGENRACIKAQLRASIARAGAEPTRESDDFGTYEYAEFQDRQCKYVISGQRIYEFLGHEWRLPLWDYRLLDFFELMPLEAKVGQALYAETLTHENWGGVWRDVPVNRRTIKPAWVQPLRFIAKAAHASMGRNAWHAFERRYFNYWMEAGAQSAIRSYGDVARDRRGARHGVAWQTEACLARHGLAYDGKPL